MNGMDDRDMIRRAQAGDRQAFGVLFDAHYARVYHYLNERLGGAPEAEDLCQEVFLKVLGSIDEYPAGGSISFDEWLLRVAQRLAREHHQARERERRRPQPQTVSLIDSPTRLNPEAIALLPAQQQQVVAYRFEAGLSTRQTASALGMDVAMVRRIARTAVETWLRCAPDAASGY